MHDDVIERAIALRRAGQGVALATVVKTWGSSPRPAGSQLCVADDGALTGSVSGGCVEGAVAQAAAEVIASSEPRLLSFGVTDSEAWDVGLACGGSIEVWVDSVAARVDVLDALQRERRAKRPAVLLTDLTSGAMRLLRAGETDDELAGAARDALVSDRSTVVERDGARALVQPFNPPLKLLIVGAVHIAQSLATMAALDGFEVTVIDPRGAFATEARFPGVTLSQQWPDAALAEREPDSRTAVVTLTHDPKLDEPALEAALRSEAFYIAALGSKRTHAARLSRLRERGLSDEVLARINGPAGLAIGARTTSEIALSIMAQCVQTLRRAPART